MSVESLRRKLKCGRAGCAQPCQTRGKQIVTVMRAKEKYKNVARIDVACVPGRWADTRRHGAVATTFTR